MKPPRSARDPPKSSPFATTRAVETWDTWFRWRENGQLRDVTIEDTWERVAAALAAGPACTGECKHRLLEAFAHWHLLLDERVLMGAGTAAPLSNADDLQAALNVASFVTASGTGSARFDQVHFEEIAALAVRALAASGELPATRRRVGIIGLGNALALLGLHYDSDAGRAQAARIAQALAQGCLAGSIALARECGALARCDDAWHAQAIRRGYRQDLIQAATEHGLRQRLLTAITSQPRLASFANGVTDALDPLASVGARATGGGRAEPDLKPDRSAALASVAAQLHLRAAIQPWIDEPITYPVSVGREPEASDIQAWNALAHELQLVAPAWRFAERRGTGAHSGHERATPS